MILQLPPHWMVATLVLNFLVQIKKKSQQKAKQEERMSKEFAKMEEAAMKAYEEDLKRMEREAAGRFLKFSTTYRLLFKPGIILLMCVFFRITFTRTNNSAVSTPGSTHSSTSATVKKS